MAFLLHNGFIFVNTVVRRLRHQVIKWKFSSITSATYFCVALVITLQLVAHNHNTTERKHDVNELLMRMRDWPTPAGRLHRRKLKPPLLCGTGQEECLSSSISMGSPVTG